MTNSAEHSNNFLFEGLNSVGRSRLLSPASLLSAEICRLKVAELSSRDRRVDSREVLCRAGSSGSQ